MDIESSSENKRIGPEKGRETSLETEELAPKWI
jgi:hypothetical protein